MVQPNDLKTCSRCARDICGQCQTNSQIRIGESNLQPTICHVCFDAIRASQFVDPNVNIAERRYTRTVASEGERNTGLDFRISSERADSRERNVRPRVARETDGERVVTEPCRQDAVAGELVHEPTSLATPSAPHVVSRDAAGSLSSGVGAQSMLLPVDGLPVVEDTVPRSDNASAHNVVTEGPKYSSVVDDPTWEAHYVMDWLGNAQEYVIDIYKLAKDFPGLYMPRTTHRDVDATPSTPDRVYDHGMLRFGYNMEPREGTPFRVRPGEWQMWKTYVREFENAVTLTETQLYDYALLKLISNQPVCRESMLIVRGKLSTVSRPVFINDVQWESILAKTQLNSNHAIRLVFQSLISDYHRNDRNISLLIWSLNDDKMWRDALTKVILSLFVDTPVKTAKAPPPRPPRDIGKPPPMHVIDPDAPIGKRPGDEDSLRDTGNKTMIIFFDDVCFCWLGKGEKAEARRTFSLPFKFSAELHRFAENMHKNGRSGLLAD